MRRVQATPTNRPARACHWLALCDELRRERNGERDGGTFGAFTASTTPTGKLSISAPTLGLSIPDMSALSFEHINRLVRLYPELREALAWAGWT